MSASPELEQVSKELQQDLELSAPPIQITYLEEAPSGVPEHPGGAPSVCTFFAAGRSNPFFASIRAHEDCEIGAFVLGLPPQGPLGDRLTSTVGMMQREGYLRPGDEGKIVRNPKAPNFVAYGPLGSLPMAPTAVLMFANPKSAMLALEAAPESVPVNGRPMCSLVPTLNHGAPVALSVGCIGSRIYTSMGDDTMLVGVRGDYLERFVAEVRKIHRANEIVGAENTRRKERAASEAHGT